MSREFECIVVGGGVAGLSAALVLGRARRRTLVLDRSRQSNRVAEHVGGLLAQEGVAPAELYARAREQLELYEAVEVRDAEATDARADGDGFVIATGDDGGTRARTLILATGMDYDVPDIPGFREHWGGAVFHCPFCHGWEVRDRRIAFCAEADAAEAKLPLVRSWSDDVTVVDPADVAGLRAADGVVEALALNDGSDVPCDAVLVEAPLRPRGDLPERLGLTRTEAGLVEIDGMARTSLPGVYAAGDVAVAPQQVAIAMGSGHLAGVAVVRELTLGRG